MSFDPTKPANGSQIVSAELRSQFTALKTLIDQMQALVVVTNDYTMQPGDHTVVCNANHNITVTLMMAGLDGVKRSVIVKNLGAFQVLVRGNIVEGAAIDGNPSFINATQGQSDVLHCDGSASEWYRVAQYKP